MNTVLIKALAAEYFMFNGSFYRYCRSDVNTAFNTERSVEVPVAMRLVEACKGRVLEVGNVLSNYGRVNHTVVDQYEKGANVVNVDIIDFEPGCSYDLIVSLSTLEHIGYDYGEVDSHKVKSAIKKIMGLLSPGGLFFFTVPTGYNKAFDRLLLDEYLQCHDSSFKLLFMRRVNVMNDWRESPPVFVEASQFQEYNHPFNYANMVVFGYRAKP